MASGRLIFSEIACKTKQLLQSITVGQEFDAVVRTITDFGAFVDLKDDAGQVRPTCPRPAARQSSGSCIHLGGACLLSRLALLHCLMQLTGAAGLVHKSELSWESVAVTSAVVKPGMNVRVKVMDVDTERGRLALSMKQCQVRPRLLRTSGCP